MKENVAATVLEYFKKRSKDGLPPGGDVNYFDAKLIDSLGIIAMIAEFEQAFGIMFSADDMQLPEFQTVAGLIRIIEGKLS